MDKEKKRRILRVANQLGVEGIVYRMLIPTKRKLKLKEKAVVLKKKCKLCNRIVENSTRTYCERCRDDIRLGIIKINK